MATSERRYVVCRDREDGTRVYLGEGESWHPCIHSAHKLTNREWGKVHVLDREEYVVPLRPKGTAAAKRFSETVRLEHLAGKVRAAQEERDAAQAEVARLTAERDEAVRQSIESHERLAKWQSMDSRWEAERADETESLRRQLDIAVTQAGDLRAEVSACHAWRREDVAEAYERAAKFMEAALPDTAMGTAFADAIRALATTPAPGPDERDARLADPGEWWGPRFVELEKHSAKLERECDALRKGHVFAELERVTFERDAAREAVAKARADQRDADVRIVDAVLQDVPGMPTLKFLREECARAIRAGGVPTVETKARPWTDDEARRYGEVPACLMDEPIAPTESAPVETKCGATRTSTCAREPDHTDEHWDMSTGESWPIAIAPTDDGGES